MLNIIKIRKVLMNFRTLIKLIAILAVAGALIWGTIIFLYKPIYSVTLNGEFIGYCEDKTQMQNRINNYMESGDGENVAFVEINDLPEYKMCLLKKGIETNDDQIFNKVIERGKDYYTYYAMVVNGEEKLYVKNLQEAEAILQELKDKNSANKDNITIEEKYNTELATFVAKEDAVNQLYQERQIESKIMVADATTNRKANNRVSTSTKVSRGKASLGITLIEPVQGRITAKYGEKSSVRSSVHTGLDIAAPGGTPIKAAASGTVVFSGRKGSFGKMLVISHGNGVQTYYAHCSKLLANVGDKVSQGEVIANVGSTGNSTGNHLHLEVRVNGQSYNPQKYVY
ncbi:MAG: M23 family metallopeptidase [Monoglobales bacterium]